MKRRPGTYLAHAADARAAAAPADAGFHCQRHTAHYRSHANFAGRHVAITSSSSSSSSSSSRGNYSISVFPISRAGKHVSTTDSSAVNTSSNSRGRQSITALPISTCTRRSHISHRASGIAYSGGTAGGAATAMVLHSSCSLRTRWCLEQVCVCVYVCVCVCV